jgi:hypothetical protein
MGSPSGCGVCKYAGYSTEGSDISPRISRTQLTVLQQAEAEWGANYFCVHFNRPVRNDEGINCRAFRFDRS